MKKTITLLLLAVLSLGTARADDAKQSFEEFRKGILNDLSNFRKTILDHYADFLNGEWHEYESLKGEVRDSKPKPAEAPKVDPVVETPVVDTPVDEPVSPDSEESPEAKPVVVTPTLPEKPTTPSTPTTPSSPGTSTTPSSPSTPSTPTTPTTPSSPSTPTTPSSPTTPTTPSKKQSVDEFTFYELPVDLPKVDFKISNRLVSTADYGAQWKTLDSNNVSTKLLPGIKKLAKEMGLNDYLTFRLIYSYIDSKFPTADDTSKMSVVHYLLANLGYDARIAMTSSGVPLLLLPFKQTIYARNYMMMSDGKYYVFAPDSYNMNKLANERLSTCTLPQDASKGSKFDLVLGELNIPQKPKSFDLEYGPIHITGEVNENLMPILYHYPQMPVGDFARSNIDPTMRKKLVAQVKSQIGNMAGDEGVSAMLNFMHNVFEYSTDEDFHGFEKPYFVEEMLYYPKNDCEDRAIFYSYLLWNALGRETQLISFPGHEATTVELKNDVSGTSYTYEGKRYYISDPTYIGSSTGMAMPQYKNTAPTFDYTYK